MSASPRPWRQAARAQLRGLQRELRRRSILAAGWALALLLGLIVILLLVLALFLALLDHVEPPEAALLTAAAVTVVALLVILLAHLAARPARRLSSREASADPRADETAADIGVRTEQLLRQGERLARSDPFGATTAAALVGLLIGASPRVRRALRELLK